MVRTLPLVPLPQKKKNNKQKTLKFGSAPFHAEVNREDFY
jgi:hypothetical protein